MKTKLPWILVSILAIALVAVVLERPSTRPAAAPQHGKILYWVDPMHPAYKSNKPGIAPDCGMDLVPVYADGYNAASPARFEIPRDRQQLIGVQTAIVETRDLGRSVRTVGRIAVDETRLHKITTKFDGYIEKLYVNYTGREVAKGQPLFTIYSPDLLATQQEYLLALRAAKTSPTLLESARQRLRLWDISEAQIRELESTGRPQKSLTIASPASGVVLAKTAVEGAKVTAGESLFDIAALDRVWVLADVYESELSAIHLGAPATMTLSYIPGRTWTGKVTFIAPTVDPMTRTVKVRVECDNRDGALKPDMFADVVISERAREVVAVPDSAVLQTGTRSVVFVVSGNKFEPRDITTGAHNDGWYEVLKGLEPGETLATQANFLIDSESRLRAALR